MSLQETTENLAPEAAPAGGFADAKGYDSTGAWPAGKYPAVIVAEGQRTNSVVRTEDVPSKNGDSRNLFIALQITDPTTGKQKFDKLMINYRPSDITNFTERDAVVQAAKQRNAGLERGAKWDDPDAQRTFLSLQQLKDLQKNTQGFVPSINGSGAFDPTPLVGQSGTINYGIDREGYNRVNGLRGFKP